MNCIRLLLLVSLVTPLLLLAAPPAVVSYQGTLLNAAGDSIAPDGNANIGFALYTAATGGNAIWREHHTVSITAGYFSADLGGGTGVAPGVDDPNTGVDESTTPVPLGDLAFDVPYFLGITVGDDLTIAAEMTPRVAFTASPYARRAAEADHATRATIADLARGLTSDATPIIENGLEVIPRVDDQGAPIAGDPINTLHVKGNALIGLNPGGDAPANGLRVQGAIVANGPITATELRDATAWNMSDISEDFIGFFKGGRTITVATGVQRQVATFSDGGLKLTGQHVISTFQPEGDFITGDYSCVIKAAKHDGNLTSHVLQLRAGTGGRIQGGVEFVDFIKFTDYLGLTMGTVSSAPTGTFSPGITLRTGTADYAEWLPRQADTEAAEPADIVGVTAGQISHNVAGAPRMMVLSSAPIIVGNSPGEEQLATGNAVAFMGQVPVRLNGRVNAGDYIVPSGNNDGTAKAVPPSELKTAEISQVVGQAWESSDEPGEKKVNTLVGLPDYQMDAHLSGRIDTLEAENADLKKRLEKLEKYLATIEAASTK